MVTTVSEKRRNTFRSTLTDSAVHSKRRLSTMAQCKVTTIHPNPLNAREITLLRLIDYDHDKLIALFSAHWSQATPNLDELLAQLGMDADSLSAHDIDDLQETLKLAASIQQYEDVLQPVVLMAYPGKLNQYILCAGHRRWVASLLAGVASISSVIRTPADRQASIEAQTLEVLYIMSTENNQRKDLSLIEELLMAKQVVNAYQAVNNATITPKEFVEKTGVNRKKSAILIRWVSEIAKPFEINPSHYLGSNLTLAQLKDALDQELDETGWNAFLNNPLSLSLPDQAPTSNTIKNTQGNDHHKNPGTKPQDDKGLAKDAISSVSPANPASGSAEDDSLEDDDSYIDPIASAVDVPPAQEDKAGAAIHRLMEDLGSESEPPSGHPKPEQGPDSGNDDDVTSEDGYPQLGQQSIQISTDAIVLLIDKLLAVQAINPDQYQLLYDAIVLGEGDPERLIAKMFFSRGES
ncbi:MAG: ParB N-terminal domain-containing protein [Marinospirillum sp.]|uniref:ParB/RepB/Spo0J family partition protein n=1 Tax=Marinospirillum sp. TaxID=2183934 RepID=UPI0019F29CB4|nr:ParB N-terminal domain-containing protein [Marinospirillum sp.]MBE0507446.1 ParB N-terminal domain-containing protein [Marinospirillum sp.]